MSLSWRALSLGPAAASVWPESGRAPSPTELANTPPPLPPPLVQLPPQPISHSAVPPLTNASDGTLTSVRKKYWNTQQCWCCNSCVSNNHCSFPPSFYIAKVVRGSPGLHTLNGAPVAWEMGWGWKRSGYQFASRAPPPSAHAASRLPPVPWSAQLTTPTRRRYPTEGRTSLQPR